MNVERLWKEEEEDPPDHLRSLQLSVEAWPTKHPYLK